MPRVPPAGAQRLLVADRDRDELEIGDHRQRLTCVPRGEKVAARLGADPPEQSVRRGLGRAACRARLCCRLDEAAGNDADRGRRRPRGRARRASRGRAGVASGVRSRSSARRDRAATRRFRSRAARRDGQQRAPRAASQQPQQPRRRVRASTRCHARRSRRARDAPGRRVSSRPSPTREPSRHRCPTRRRSRSRRSSSADGAACIGAVRPGGSGSRARRVIGSRRRRARCRRASQRRSS